MFYCAKYSALPSVSGYKMFLVLMLDLTLIFVQNLSPPGSLHEAAKGADFLATLTMVL